MKSQVVLRRDQKADAEGPAPIIQPYVFPADLYTSKFAAGGTRWVCVRTRPRWEKKFAGWLIERRRSCFLPVFPHATLSGRKRRVSLLPLFPGFVFVAGDWAKKDFTQTGSVAYVLRPRGPQEAAQLDRELAGIWRGLTSGLYVAPVHALAGGEVCRIIQGPLQGAEAKFERMGRGGRLILQVEMMGGGIAVEVPAEEVAVGP